MRLKPVLLTMIVLGCLACGLSRCGHRHNGADELILFTITGSHPFEDYVNLIQPDGSDEQPFLTPKRGRSYTFASGNSLNENFVVTVHEQEESGKIRNHLYEYHPVTGQCRRLPELPRGTGAGVISPDGTRAAFAVSPERRGSRALRLWTMDLKTGDTQKLTTGGGDDEWDGYPVWSPDGREIIFLRLRLTPEGVRIKLMRVPSGGGESTIILGEADEVSVVCYNREGDRLAMWSRPGLEVMGLRDSSRVVILPRGKIPDRIYQGSGAGGMAWSRTNDKIAIALIDERANESELWTINGDGSSVDKIHSMPMAEGKITVAGYVRTQ
jgi:Tol biopolymer transport system component